MISTFAVLSVRSFRVSSWSFAAATMLADTAHAIAASSSSSALVFSLLQLYIPVAPEAASQTKPDYSIIVCALFSVALVDKDVVAELVLKPRMTTHGPSSTDWQSPFPFSIYSIQLSALPTACLPVDVPRYSIQPRSLCPCRAYTFKDRLLVTLYSLLVLVYAR